MQFSPRIRDRVHGLIAELDDGARPIAAVWRDAGRRARAEQQLQPSYESVRRIVNEQRRARRLEYSRVKRGAILAAELLWRTRDPRAIALDLITGDDIERRRHEYQRRPRDDSSRTRPRGAA